ncbi:hypothetical protein AN641_01830 [Candidatus Epulonipiscioides gigas]|nr:hypothetical protein AN641_01830 [Epulopiscium sp. SCG-C07WGA-EpuloA2]
MAKFYVSMMCADMTHLADEMKNLEEAEIEGYHLDIMDGRYVPNFALGVADIIGIRKLTNKDLDVHLMIENPEKHIDLFVDLGANMISFHLNSTRHVDRLINTISSKGIKVGVALNPSETIEEVKYIIEKLDFILVMGVNPGFAGQQYVNYVDQKFKDLKNLIAQRNLKVELYLDGCVNQDRVEYLDKIGVDGYVLGTSLLFGKDRTYKEIMDEVNNKIRG